MSNVVIGNLGVVEQPVKFHWSPSKGWTTQRTFRGDRFSIRSSMFLFKSSGWDVEITEGPSTNSTMVCTIGADIDGNITEPVDNWEIVPNIVTKDLLDADNAAVGVLPIEDLEDLRRAQANPAAWNAGQFTGDALEIYRLMKKGTHSVLVFQPILKHTINVSRQWQVAASLAYLKTIISTNTLASQENIPNWIVQSMPNETPATSITNVSYGWFKMPPTITVESWRRTQITQEWQYGLWSTLLYGFAI